MTARSEDVTNEILIKHQESSKIASRWSGSSAEFSSLSEHIVKVGMPENEALDEAFRNIVNSMEDDPSAQSLQNVLKIIAQANAFWKDRLKEACWAIPARWSLIVASFAGALGLYFGCMAIEVLPYGFRVFAGINSLILSGLGPAGMADELVNNAQPSSEAKAVFLEALTKSRRDKFCKIMAYVLGLLVGIPVTAYTLLQIKGRPVWQQVLLIIPCYARVSVTSIYSLLGIMQPMPNELTLNKKEKAILKRIRDVALSRLNANEGRLGQLDPKEITTCMQLLEALLSTPTPPSSKKLLFILVMATVIAVIGLLGPTVNTAILFSTIFPKIPITILNAIFIGMLTIFTIVPFAKLILNSVQLVFSSVYKVAGALAEGRLYDFIKEKILLFNLFPKSTLGIIGCISILGLTTGFPGGKNGKEMTIVFLDEMASLVTQGSSNGSTYDFSDGFSDGYMHTDYTSEGASSWADFEEVMSWIVAACAAVTSISFNIFFSVVALLNFILARTKFFTSDQKLRDKADFMVAAKQFIAALPGLPAGKLMLLLEGLPKNVMSGVNGILQEAGVSNEEHEALISKVKTQRAAINLNSFFPASTPTERSSSLNIQNEGKDDPAMGSNVKEEGNSVHRDGTGPGINVSGSPHDEESPNFFNTNIDIDSDPMDDAGSDSSYCPKMCAIM